MSGFVHQYKNVERVAVFAERGGDKAEVEGEHHTFGKQAAWSEQVRFGVIVKFVSRPLGGSMMALQWSCLESSLLAKDVRSAMVEVYSHGGKWQKNW